MDPLAAALVLTSAVLHPLWYALLKRDPDPDAAFVGLNVAVTLVALGHAGLRGVALTDGLAVWRLFLVSAAGQIAYGLAIVGVLKRGDLSAYYPIIRASPLAIVAIGFVVLGERYRPVLLVGIALVLAGSVALQYRRGARLLSEPLTLGLAVLALLASAVYALADSRSVRRVDPVAVLFWVQTITVPVFAALHRRRRLARRPATPPPAWAPVPLRYAVLGGLAYASYYLVLLAYGRGANVAAVNAVRQAAIPISVVIGSLWLAEGAMGRRLAAAFAIAAGVVVIVLAR
jgi:drug/metabolite transporter (DMT)-like permease